MAEIPQNLEGIAASFQSIAATAQNSETIFRLLVDSVSDYAIFVLDAEGRIVTWNKGAQRLKGYTQAEIVGHHFSRFYTEEDLARGLPRRALAQAASTGRFESEGWRVRKDGARFWASVVITRLVDAHGHLVGFGKVTRDLSERKKAESALERARDDLELRVKERTEELEAEKEHLAENEARYRLLTDSLPQMMWSAGPDGTVDYVNKRCLAYSGLDSVDKYASGWKDSIHPADLPMVWERWIASIQSGEPFDCEYRIRRHDGVYHWFLGRAVPLRFADGRVRSWIGTATDIEEQKRIIEKLETERRLREQFVSTLTHDLRNPLSAAKTSAQMISRYPQSPERLTSLTGRIVDSLNRANQMIENLLDANRIRAGEPLHLEMAECELESLVREAVGDLATVHGDRFVVETEGSDFRGYWSATGLRRIVENLSTNAVKYGRENGAVTLRLRRAGEWVTLEVHNSGNPIRPEDQRRLFEPFQRGRDAEQSRITGWGLGLPLVKGLTEAHGGRVSVKSSPEAGTSFVVELPLSRVSE